MVGQSFPQPQPYGFTQNKSALSPVILVPGHGGNQIEWKVELPEGLLDGECSDWNNLDWTRSWFNLWHVMPGGNTQLNRMYLLIFVYE